MNTHRHPFLLLLLLPPLLFLYSGVIVTGSWDKTVRLWDIREKDASIGVHAQPNKVFALDVVQYKLVVAMAGRHVFIYDIRYMAEPIQRRESSLKFMTRCVKCMPNGQGLPSSRIIDFQHA